MDAKVMELARLIETECGSYFDAEERPSRRERFGFDRKHLNAH